MCKRLLLEAALPSTTRVWVFLFHKPKVCSFEVTRGNTVSDKLLAAALTNLQAALNSGEACKILINRLFLKQARDCCWPVAADRIPRTA